MKFEAIIFIFLLVSSAELGVLLGIVENHSHDGLAFFNPIRNRRKWKSMNWFGVIFCTIGINLICPLWAICYWIYKLCTFRRKQNEDMGS